MSGCASTYRVAFAPETQGKLANTAGIVAVEKDEIGTSIDPSGAGVAVGGLIGAIVDSAVNSSSSKKAEAAVADVRNALIEYAFDREMSDAFARRFSDAPSVSLLSVVVSKNTAAPELSRLVSESTADAVAVVFVRHLLSPDFAEAVIPVEIVVCAKSAELTALAKPRKYGDQEVPVLYRNKFQSIWPLPPGVKSTEQAREKYAAAWAMDGGVHVRNALQTACNEIAELAYWDVTQPARENYSDIPGETRRTHIYNMNSRIPSNAKLIKTENGRVWVRLADGSLHAQAE
ncbi:hypothetical protein [Ereboglobus sp. PH5-10]|uniref:hypothetical protein n=1 Tax=Ereboglobus sp. PH5-10 TaxID=2940629 RepID=UPI00240608AF|nr:hypothetical protein [Ereboglobus sp. PH5-10]